MADLHSLYPCGRIARRRFLHQAAAGFLGSALSTMWADDGKLMQDARLPGQPAAKSVIFLFMCGGVSHIDTFDPKDNKFAGKIMDAIGFGDNNAPMKRPVIPILRTFKPYGKSGIPVSDWFPNVGETIDDIAVVRSMYCHQTNHFPAVLEGATGKPLRQFEHPCLGSWVSYALGTANKELPTFVNLGRPSSPVQLTGGYLGATYSATPFQSGSVPIPNLLPQKGSSSQQRDREMQALVELDKQFRADYQTESEIAARSRAFELAGSMMLKAPAIVDFSTEPDHVKQLYGIGVKETDDFGRQLLLARRLAEQGVRFIQICHGGGGNGSWDAHDDMKTHGPLCRAVDKPVSGLIRDLKQRGMLDSTLVVFTSEFGRTPWSQNTTGRDHNAMGFTSLLAGGGVKGGVVEGATDEVGYRAVDKPHYISDLQSTILRQVGLNHKKMDFVLNGRPFHLVEEGLGPIDAILA
ncbi:MAG TPA: DUF1501 domain-containing protein [Candidatus Sulfopaludibacter sp.]|jgi:hypothetical protein|nr:DUF1501 domain-containing protein [Candidatus Sulfopaludibacter sp.]